MWKEKFGLHAAWRVSACNKKERRSRICSQSQATFTRQPNTCLLCLVMAKRGLFDLFTEEEETKRLIFSNGHMTIDLLSPIVWGVLLSICLVAVAMAFDNKSKFVGFTNG